MAKFMLQALLGEVSSCECTPGEVVEFESLQMHHYQCTKCGEPLQTTLDKNGYRYTYSRVPFNRVQEGDIVIIGDPHNQHRHEVMAIRNSVQTDSLSLRGFGSESWVKNGYVTVEITSPQKI